MSPVIYTANHPNDMLVMIFFSIFYLTETQNLHFYSRSNNVHAHLILTGSQPPCLNIISISFTLYICWLYLPTRINFALCSLSLHTQRNFSTHISRHLISSWILTFSWGFWGEQRKNMIGKKCRNNYWNVGDHGGKVVSIYIWNGTIKEKLWEIWDTGSFWEGNERRMTPSSPESIDIYLLCYYPRMFHIASCKHRVNHSCSWQE